MQLIIFRTLLLFNKWQNSTTFKICLIKVVKVGSAKILTLTECQSYDQRTYRYFLG